MILISFRSSYANSVQAYNKLHTDFVNTQILDLHQQIIIADAYDMKKPDRKQFQLIINGEMINDDIEDLFEKEIYDEIVKQELNEVLFILIFKVSTGVNHSDYYQMEKRYFSDGFKYKANYLEIFEDIKLMDFRNMRNELVKKILCNFYNQRIDYLEKVKFILYIHIIINFILLDSFIQSKKSCCKLLVDFPIDMLY